MKENQLSPFVRPVPQHLQVTEQGALDPNFGYTAEAELRQYYQIFFKYRFVIAGMALAGAILSLVYAFLTTPQYTAESKIKISTYEPVLSATKIEDVLQQKSRESGYLETQVQEITSFSLADRVLQDKSLRDLIFQEQDSRHGIFSFIFGSEDRAKKKEFVTGYTSPISEIKYYIDLIKVNPVRRTSLVSILATTDKPDLSAKIANAHASAYIDWVRTARVEQQSAGLKFLKGQAEELKEKVAGLEREMADYAEENSIVAVNKDENIVAQRMAQLNKLQTDVNAERLEAENLYKEAERALTSDSAGFDDSSTQTMRSKLAELEAEYGNLSSKFLPTYPKMQQTKAEIDNLKRSIDGQRKQIVMGLKAKFLAAQEKEKNVREELDQQKSRAFELSKKQVQYNILNRELDSSRELLQNVLRQIKETTLAVESNASNVSIVDYAMTPKFASFPKKKLFLLGGLIVGLGLGTALALLLAYIDNTFRTPEQITSMLSLPSLGVVPSFSIDDKLGLPTAEIDASVAITSHEGGGLEEVSSEGDINQNSAITLYNSLQVPLVYVDRPKSLAAEAYRTIRTGILLSQAGHPPRTILVTSAQSSEGKTTTASNLAATLASTGGNVLLIDADLRRPAVHKYFGLERGLLGVVEVLTGQVSLDDAIVPEVVTRVSILPSGRIPPNPAELLGSPEMQQLIKHLSERYDYVIVDCPPVLPVTDTVILSRYVDGVVLVVKAGVTPRRVVTDAKNRLRHVGAHLLGTVLNNVNVTGGDYYYYNRYYYSYYSEEQSSSKSTKAA